MAGFLRDRRGNVTPLMVIVLIPLLGAFALAAEVSGWHTVQRSMQNAADAAVVAAATNACDPTATCHTTSLVPSYIEEARAVSARFGYTNGVNNTLVTALNNQTCPSPSTDTNCYKVTISRDVSLGLTRAVGFAGNQSSGGRERVVASAMASPATLSDNFCIMALGTSQTGKANKDAFLLDGGSKFDLGGCAVYSNGSATCNGGGSSDYYGISAMVVVGSIKGSNCGQPSQQYVSQPTLADPYAYLSNVSPPDPPNIPDATGCTPLILSAGTLDWSSYTAGSPRKTCVAPTFSGTPGVVNITTAPGGSVLIIGGGGNLNIPAGWTLKAAPVAGSGLTVVFSGTAGASNAPGFVTGSGTLDFGGPDATSGSVWKGIALYQDERMKKAADQTYSGSSPTFNITGLIYAPYADLRIDGAINHQTSGYACVGVVAHSVHINGTGSLFDYPTSGCAEAGLVTPPAPGAAPRAKLVL